MVLVVLDGWGYRTEREGNAIALARTPTWDALWARAPRALIEASGLAVGLPKAKGNSEVGHLNLGAGRGSQPISCVFARRSGRSFFDNAVLRGYAGSA